MCSAIQNILTLAKQTFARKIGEDGSMQRRLDSGKFIQNLEEICDLMKQLDVGDLGLDHSPSLFPDKIPIHSFEQSRRYTSNGQQTVERSERVKNTSLDPEYIPHTKPPVTYIRYDKVTALVITKILYI